MKRIITIFAAVALTACAGTQHSVAPITDVPAINTNRLAPSCVAQVYARESAETFRSVSYYTALISNAKACLVPIQDADKHPQKTQIMRLYATVITNSVKAHDSNQARAWLEKFRNNFPMQDLLLEDYTSFIDTMTALLYSNNMNAYQLSRLNISSTLKQELNRQQQWLVN